jgi:hypothetical protein
MRHNLWTNPEDCKTCDLELSPILLLQTLNHCHWLQSKNVAKNFSNIFSVTDRLSNFNETLLAKEEVQLKTKIATLERMSKLEQNVRNLMANVSDNVVKNKETRDALLLNIGAVKFQVKWFINFLEDIASGSKDENELKTGNNSVSTSSFMGSVKSAESPFLHTIKRTGDRSTLVKKPKDQPKKALITNSSNTGALNKAHSLFFWESKMRADFQNWIYN